MMFCAPLPEGSVPQGRPHQQLRQKTRLRLVASHAGVRQGLKSLRLALHAAGLDATDIDRAEMILAEVLKNIAEHAFAGLPPGIIQLHLSHRSTALHCRIIDSGRPMPGNILPGGLAKGDGLEAGLSGACRANLPEGGFGWPLIHHLTQALSYLRKDGLNRLTLSIPLGA